MLAGRSASKHYQLRKSHAMSVLCRT